MAAGYHGLGVLCDALFFGGGGGFLVAAFAICLCIFFRPAQCKIYRVYKLTLFFSLIYYVLINILFLLANREGYFLLALYAGLKYEIFLIVFSYICIFLFVKYLFKKGAN